MDLTDSLIKSRARSFDLESVFSLDCAGLNLRTLSSSLNSCSSLWSLDLSRNALSSAALGALDGSRLAKLRVLRLASCGLTDVALTSSFPSLRTLSLEGNALSSLAALERLAANTPNLAELGLKALSGAGANPLCSSKSYRMDVLALWPSLRVLDGERLEQGGKTHPFYVAYAEMDRATAQWAPEKKGNAVAAASSAPARAVEDWLPSAAWPSITPDAAQADLEPKLKALRAALGDAQRVLDADPFFEELEKKYGGGGSAAASASASSGAEGNFGTFGED